jgi:hypothetical protein
MSGAIGGSHVGSFKMPKLEIVIIHCKLFCGLHVRTQPVDEDDDEEGMNISLDVPFGHTPPIVS